MPSRSPPGDVPPSSTTSRVRLRRARRTRHRSHAHAAASSMRHAPCTARRREPGLAAQAPADRPVRYCAALAAEEPDRAERRRATELRSPGRPKSPASPRRAREAAKPAPSRTPMRLTGRTAPGRRDQQQVVGAVEAAHRLRVEHGRAAHTDHPEHHGITASHDDRVRPPLRCAPSDSSTRDGPPAPVRRRTARGRR